MDMPMPVFILLVALWVGSEVVINQRRSADRGRAYDRGTLRLLYMAVYGAVGLALVLAWQRVGQFSPAWRMPLFWTGCTMMAAGMLLRAWSVRVLAEHFTVDVAIRPGHELVRRGPYRLLRHPSYTGSLLTFYGFALALGSAWSLAVIVAAVTPAFLWRIQVEEAVLRRAFPDAYPAYARATKRLVPFVW